MRNRMDLPSLTEDQILRWADTHRRRTDRWPTRDSGPIREAPGETWSAVSTALHAGVRGLPGGSSLAQLLAEHRGVRNTMRLPPLNVRQIRAWMKAYRARTGRWPNEDSGPIPEAPGEVWKNVDHALRVGRRGLLGGSSLYRLRPDRRAPTTTC